MANKRIQDLEQTTDLTNDDLIPLDTTKKTFATTLKSLTEWLKNTFQTTSNLEQALSDATDKYPSSKVLKDESSRIVSIMDNKVSKSGDTMTGLLQTTSIFRTCGRTNRIIEVNSADNSKTWGTFEVNKPSNTETASYMFAFNPSDNNKHATIGIHIKGDEKWATCPNSKLNYSIATTDSHGDNWIRLGNGLQICWGAGNNGQWNFPVPFKDANYGLTMSTQTGHGGEIWISELGLVNKTNTGFYKADSAKTNPFTWTAIGYWY